MDRKVCIGLRVVRGPDWEWGDQDGGEGHVGTVVELDVARRAAVVQWDCAERCLYRCGHDNKYDLRVFDRGPTGAWAVLLDLETRELEAVVFNIVYIPSLDF